MKVLGFLILAFSVVLAQEILPELPNLPYKCCTCAEIQTALINLFSWITERSNCDPLFPCIRKCLNITTGITRICSPNNELHVNFNVWLLYNYHCLPNTVLQCLKGCIRYNSYPPCPTISINPGIITEDAK
ncbi:hypothetical protein FQR65_LT00866 [Abscondita terminalis]|nr:hypothetical protein FQR65_LT00866 [Abscondita terminalis]